jgi:hypothetical protein
MSSPSAITLSRKDDNTDRPTTPRPPAAGRSAANPFIPYNSQTRRAPQNTEGARAMTDYLIAAVLFVAMITTLVYLWKREHS